MTCTGYKMDCFRAATMATPHSLLMGMDVFHPQMRRCHFLLESDFFTDVESEGYPTS
jgi:hypothetical protein